MEAVEGVEDFSEEGGNQEVGFLAQDRRRVVAVYLEESQVRPKRDQAAGLVDPKPRLQPLDLKSQKDYLVEGPKAQIKRNPPPGSQVRNPRLRPRSQSALRPRSLDLEERPPLVELVPSLMPRRCTWQVDSIRP